MIFTKPTTLFFVLGFFILASCNQTQSPQTKELSSYVDPFIGSGGHGHVFVGANVPFGAVQTGPNNEMEAWDWCSGYHYSDSILIGFAHTQLSGTGIGDLGDILFMPVSESYKPLSDSVKYDWKSLYSHDKEIAKAGYYSLFVERYNILAELTASERVGFHKYNFKEKGNSRLIVDLEYGTGWDALVKSGVKQIDDNSIEGYRLSKGWSKDQRIYFNSEFSKKIIGFEVLQSSEELGTMTVILEFEGNGELLAKTAISPVSVEGAKNNLETEIGHWDFALAYETANKKWNNELAKIEVDALNETDKKVFYTAMYHTMIAPSLFNDVDGSYRGTDKEVHSNPGFDTYTTFSLWDTYRAAHPLFTIMHPDRVDDFVNSMIAIYEQQGKLPIWHLMGSETNTMVGYHAVPVIADAYLKGFTGFDAEKAFEAMKASAMLDEEGMEYIKEMEYIPAEKEIESVAKALEYAIDDWCIAQMAKAMGKIDDYEYFSKRAGYYKHYFDKETQFMRGKLSDGTWRSPFNPISSQHRADDYCEGNAWQYTWLVPHDPEGLISLFDSEEQFVSKLDSLFSIESILVEGASVDITGLIGQYAHGNEPSHHTAYLYAFAGQQWKTAEKVRFIMDDFYTDQPDGIIGNEDCGQMSAWHVFSAMGIYPVNPANGIYVFGSPQLHKANIKLTDGKTFTIEAIDNSKENIYIQSVELNGEVYNKSFIKHSDIMAGGNLKFFMGPKPNEEFGKAMINRPKSIKN